MQKDLARKDLIVENLHGTLVSDPYRWMEDIAAPETCEWVKWQNEKARQYLDSIPAREEIGNRLNQLWNHPRYHAPVQRGGRYFHLSNDGLQNQAVLFVQDGLAGDPRVLLDPNRLSADGTVALSHFSPSPDGRFLAYSLSESGSDRQIIRVRNVESGEDLPDTIHWCRFTNIAWDKDSSGFYYTRFPEPGTVPPEDECNFARVCHHIMQTSQAEDAPVYGHPTDKRLGLWCQVTHDGRYILIHANLGTESKNRVFCRETGADMPFIPLLNENDARYDFAGNQDTQFFFHTDKDAPRGRVIAIDVNEPSPDKWRTIVPETEDAIERVDWVGGRLLVTYLHHARHQVKVFTPDGGNAELLPLPDPCSIAEVEGTPDDPEVFMTVSTFLKPSFILRCLIGEQKTEVWREPGCPVESAGFQAVQEFIPSRDGTLIPVFIIAPKGLRLDGSHPALLYGYGGFNICYKPFFYTLAMAWVERGGVFAVANLRGGNEYGELWHQAGMLDKKQNVFDDFIGAAEGLIKKGYTAPERLGIMGRSNGGLLTAACMLQRPDLFGAVLSNVPVIDMLRYHRFTVGRYWIPEYGDPENSEHFHFLHAYSPLHNIKPGIQYPPVLIGTAEGDDRVWPAHAYKFAATLQEGGAEKVWLRVDQKAGHGHGKPTAKIIAEETDFLAFFTDQLCHD